MTGIPKFQFLKILKIQNKQNLKSNKAQNIFKNQTLGGGQLLPLTNFF